MKKKDNLIYNSLTIETISLASDTLMNSATFSASVGGWEDGGYEEVVAEDE